MKLDEWNRGIGIDYQTRYEKIKDQKLRELFSDVQTLDNIFSGELESFFDPLDTRYAIMNEANNDLMLAIESLDRFDFVGGYAHLKVSWELMLMCLFMNAPKEIAVKESRNRNWRKSDNNFGKMIDDHANWPHFKMILDNFPSWKKKQKKSDDRLNKIRHKHSIKYFENVHRQNLEQWNKKRRKNSVEDCEYLITMFLITWLILQPSLLVFSTGIAESRYPGIMAAFPSEEFLEKYLPEINDDFIKNSNISKETYDGILNAHEYTYEQQLFKGYSIISSKLNINEEDEEHFDLMYLHIYNLWKTKPNVHFIIKEKTYAWFSNSKFRNHSLDISTFMWDFERSAEFWDDIKKRGFTIEKKSIENNVYWMLFKK